jgi:tRNA(adenine34) deaminase
MERREGPFRPGERDGKRGESTEIHADLRSLTDHLPVYTINLDHPGGIERPAEFPTMSQADESFMRESLCEAEAALEHGEVPVGCVAVVDGEILARSHNRRESWADPTAHAEMIVLREAARKLGRWRLSGVSLYVTLEPCAMCAGALVLARVDRLVYGAADPKAGACGSVFDILRDARLNHRVEVVPGILEDECGSMLKRFFAKRREED